MTANGDAVKLAAEHVVGELLAKVAEVAVLRLEPGDRIVAKIGEDLEPQDAEALRDMLVGFFPGHDVLLLQGLELEVARDVARPSGAKLPLPNPNA
jgi:hypothetical protein